MVIILQKVEIVTELTRKKLSDSHITKTKVRDKQIKLIIQLDKNPMCV